MDYKEAYDDICKKLMSAYNTTSFIEVKKAIGQIHPELCESEDERIINQLITLVNSTGEVLLIPTNKEELIAWLNKCKESLHISETCKENGDSFTDEDERIINQLITLVNSTGEVLLIPTNKEELIAWLNKCKESLHISETCKENGDSFTDEDERIYSLIYSSIKNERPIASPRNKKLALAYLEKQKEEEGYDFIPVKSTLEYKLGFTDGRDFEKQKEHKPEHFELKAGKWYICHRAFCCRADHLTVKEGERFMCEKDGVVKGFIIKEPEKYFIECSAPAPMEDEQKEPHYTKRNALFDKCVANCDPAVMQRVSDEVDEMLGKEQKPVERHLDLTELLVPQRNIGQKLVTDGWSIKDANFHSNLLYLMRENNSKEGWEGCYEWLEELPSRISLEQKPAEWSFPYGVDETVDKLIAIAECLEMDGDCLFNGHTGTECGKFLRDLARKQVECKPAEWSEEDEEMIQDIIAAIDTKIAASDFHEMERWLKSLRPSWKLTEEQMNAIDRCVDYLEESDNEDAEIMESLQEQLHKLM